VAESCEKENPIGEIGIDEGVHVRELE